MGDGIGHWEGRGEHQRGWEEEEGDRRTVCSFWISSSKLTRPGLAAVTRS